MKRKKRLTKYDVEEITETKVREEITRIASRVFAVILGIGLVTWGGATFLSLHYMSLTGEITHVTVVASISLIVSAFVLVLIGVVLVFDI